MRSKMAGGLVRAIALVIWETLSLVESEKFQQRKNRPSFELRFIKRMNFKFYHTERQQNVGLRKNNAWVKIQRRKGPMTVAVAAITNSQRRNWGFDRNISAKSPEVTYSFELEKNKIFKKYLNFIKKNTIILKILIKPDLQL